MSDGSKGSPEISMPPGLEKMVTNMKTLVTKEKKAIVQGAIVGVLLFAMFANPEIVHGETPAPKPTEKPRPTLTVDQEDAKLKAEREAFNAGVQATNQAFIKGTPIPKAEVQPTTKVTVVVETPTAPVDKKPDNTGVLAVAGGMFVAAGAALVTAYRWLKGETKAAETQAPKVYDEDAAAKKRWSWRDGNPEK